jgi:hypothetical protein
MRRTFALLRPSTLVDDIDTDIDAETGRRG